MEDSKKINFKKYSSLEGDASFRKFYRKKNTKDTSIIVFANKEKEKNLLDYASVNKLLNINGILVPNLIGNIPNWKKIRKIAKKYKLLIANNLFYNPQKNHNQNP